MGSDKRAIAGSNIQGLDTLEAWKKSLDFAVRVYKEVLPKLPASERWNLDQQIRRAVCSVPANIAEGHGRRYYQENVHFCYVARGSLTEVYSHLSLANQLGYIPAEQLKETTKVIDELIRILNGYIAYLKRAKIGADEPGASLGIRESQEPYSAVGLDEIEYPPT